MAGYFLAAPSRPGLFLGYAGVPGDNVEPALITLGKVLGDCAQLLGD